MLTLWNILGIIAIICLLASFAIGKNSIWGTLTLGIIISVIVFIVNLIIGNDFNWELYKIILSSAILIGALFEIVGRLAKGRSK